MTEQATDPATALADAIEAANPGWVERWWRDEPRVPGAPLIPSCARAASARAYVHGPRSGRGFARCSRWTSTSSAPTRSRCSATLCATRPTCSARPGCPWRVGTTSRSGRSPTTRTTSPRRPGPTSTRPSKIRASRGGPGRPTRTSAVVGTGIRIAHRRAHRHPGPGLEEQAVLGAREWCVCSPTGDTSRRDPPWAGIAWSSGGSRGAHPSLHDRARIPAAGVRTARGHRRGPRRDGRALSSPQAARRHGDRRVRAGSVHLVLRVRHSLSHRRRGREHRPAGRVLHSSSAIGCGSTSALDTR